MDRYARQGSEQDHIKLKHLPESQVNRDKLLGIKYQSSRRYDGGKMPN